MQKIATKNNLSETTFICEDNKDLNIRWFSPNQEVDFCGHGTIAAAVILNAKENTRNHYNFNGKKVNLKIKISDRMAVIDIPIFKLKKLNLNEFSYSKIIKNRIISFCESDLDYVIGLKEFEDLVSFEPDLNSLFNSSKRGLIISFKNKDKVYFRYFCPKLGFDEDPATGSALSTLYPYFFSDIDGMNNINFIQFSNRKGFSNLVLVDNSRISISTTFSKIITKDLQID